MKKGLLMVIVLLSMASFMAAMAYSSATITNAAKLKVVNTDQALLALENTAPRDKTVGALDSTVRVENGELVFRLGNGLGSSGSGDEFYGLQPNSEYVWNYLFTVKNKSVENIKVTISATGKFAPYITFGTSLDKGRNADWGIQGQQYVIDKIESGSNNIENIALKIKIPKGYSISESEILGSIIVKADAQ